MGTDPLLLSKIGLGQARKEPRAEVLWFSDAVYRGETGYFDGKKLRHGLGVMLYQSGRVYEGFWIKDRRQGNGYEKYKNGDVYQGDYHKGRPQGKGRRIWAETGEIYEGEWYQGMRHGIGTWNQNHEHDTTLVTSNQNGRKRIAQENYTGRFMNNHFEGYGIFRVKYT